MFLKRLLHYFIFTCLYTTTVFAQKTETYYDINWKKCEPGNARRFSILEKTDSGYYRKNYFMPSGKAQMVALYEDSACKVQNGYATFYYANGYPERVGHFVHGKREGVAIGYHNNGALSDSGEYHNGIPAGNIYGWYPNGYISDSVARIKDSLFVHVSWFDDGAVAAAGREMNGKKQGSWVFYRRDGSKAAHEVYENGKRISTKHFDEGGTEISVDTARNEHPAEFKGGTNKWLHYLEGRLSWPYGYHFQNTNKVVLQIQMTIDEAGNVTNVYVTNPFHPAFDKIATDAVSKGPKWMPAIQHNRPVPYRFTQSVTFEENH